MQNFYYSVPTKVAFGTDSLDGLPEYIKEFGTRVLLVYGGGSIKRTGLYDKVITLLCEHGITYEELSGVEPNPRLTTVKKGVAICKEKQVDVVVPIGGGSTIDCAKAVAAAAFYDGDPWDLVEDSDKIGEVLPIIAVATMAATGSEMDPFAVITNEATKQKMDLSAESLYPAYAILNPEFTYSVPAYQTAAGVADIMSHIFEVYFADVEDTFMQDRVMEALLKTLVTYGPVACREPENYEARANILWASEWAINGMIACGKSGAWPAHSIEHQLSAYYDITHGHGLAIITPVLMEYILNEKSLPRLVNYGVNVWEIDRSLPDVEIAKKAIRKTKELYEEMGLSLDLGSLNVPYGTDFEAMATQAASEGLDECLV
ncbi:MAG: iron-containing alcohol dehydrogenase, partial [Wujia sp.]